MKWLAALMLALFLLALLLWPINVKPSNEYCEIFARQCGMDGHSKTMCIYMATGVGCQWWRAPKPEGYYP